MCATFRRKNYLFGKETIQTYLKTAAKNFSENVADASASVELIHFDAIGKRPLALSVSQDIISDTSVCTSQSNV